MAAVDWFASTAVAPAAPARRRPARTDARRAPKAAARRAPVRRVRGGILWISTFAVLLAGVVAVNVAVLRANIGVSNLDKQEQQLQADNATLASKLSSDGAAQRIAQIARASGLVPAPAADTGFIDLGR